MSIKSHEKELQKVPIMLLDWIKIEQDIRETMQKYKTSGQFFDTL
jgi:hypothetical protein